MGVVRSLVLIASFLSAYRVAVSQQADVVAQFNLRVVAADSAKEFPHVQKLKDQRLISLGRDENGQTFEVPLGAYILVKSVQPGRTEGYAVSPLHGVVESPSGTMHLPRDVTGVLRTTKLGDATIMVRAYPTTVQKQVVNSGGSLSSNWSGYVLTGGPFSFIQGQWRVPTVQQIGGSQVSATWIGIDGLLDLNSPTVLQVGTDQNNSCCIFPPSYAAWYELFPANPVSIPNSVSPGDLMIALISPKAGAGATVTPGIPATWTISLNDATAGWVFTTDVSYTGKLNSAEWIEEAPGTCSDSSTNCTAFPLADYGSVTFDIQDFVCQPNGPCPRNGMGSPGFVAAQSVTMEQNASNFPVFSVPSNPDGDTDGFTVQYAPLSPAVPSPPGPIIVTKALPDAMLGRAYSQGLVVAQDSAPQWQLVGGSLPPGLSFVSGSVSGTPSQSGSFVFVVQVADSSNPGATAQQQVSVNVVTQPPRGDFGLSASPTVIHARATKSGCTGSTMVAVTPVNGFNSVVTFSAAITGFTVSLPSTASTSELTVSADFCDGWPNSIQVTGRSGPLTHTIEVGMSAPGGNK